MTGKNNRWLARRPSGKVARSTLSQQRKREMPFGTALLFSTAVAGAMICLASTRAGVLPPDDRPPPVANSVLLIEQLGHDDYAVREHAQAELARQGAAAFDALLAAQDSDDREVAHRASRLLQRLSIPWTHPHDPPHVERLLRNYADQSNDNRRARIANLADLDGYAGVEALCRIVCYDRSELLSKEAALALLNLVVSAPASSHDSLSERIVEASGSSARRGAEWLRASTHSLAGDNSSTDAWDTYIADEVEALMVFPQRSSPELVQNLLRWRVDQLLAAGQLEDARIVLEQTLDLTRGTQTEILEAIDWLIDRGVYSIVIELAERHPERFAENFLLQYRLAEVYQHLDERELADEFSLRALEMGGDDYDNRIETATHLYGRGLVDWAEREYRRVIEKADRGSRNGIRSRIYLSELLHDRLDDKEAALELQQVVDLIESDPAVARMVQERIRTVDSIRGRMHYFFAMDYAASGEFEKHRESLDEALQCSSLDVDIIIALYRLAEEEEEHRIVTLIHLADAIKHFSDIVDILNRQNEIDWNAADFIERQNLLALYLNTYAWLVSNTEGDYQRAIECSRMSLKITPDSAGYLDTLARCYYALGDYEAAVKTQRQAVELDPHTLPLNRQLKFFEAELARTESEASVDTP